VRVCTARVQSICSGDLERSLLDTYNEHANPMTYPSFWTNWDSDRFVGGRADIAAGVDASVSDGSRHYQYEQVITLPPSHQLAQGPTSPGRDQSGLFIQAS
jgi:hypothetical protein